MTQRVRRANRLRTPASVASLRSSPRAALADHARQRVDPSITQSADWRACSTPRSNEPRTWLKAPLVYSSLALAVVLAVAAEHSPDADRHRTRSARSSRGSAARRATDSAYRCPGNTLATCAGLEAPVVSLVFVLPTIVELRQVLDLVLGYTEVRSGRSGKRHQVSDDEYVLRIEIDDRVRIR